MSDLSTLSRTPPQTHAIPRPRRRWLTRLAIPLLILGAALAMLAYAARSTFLPATEVWVAPVVAAPQRADTAAPARADAPVAQGPGWVEPDPFAIGVPALAEGVLSELLVLEGQRVRAGEVIARLVPDDARIAFRQSEAALAEAHAAVRRATVDASAAEAREAEFLDELDRKRPLLDAGGVSAGELARLELRWRAAQQSAEAARIAIAESEARVARTEADLDEARLRMDRMEIRAPADGVVMDLAVEPGMRVGMTGAPGADDRANVVVHLYDPARLQVRVDVPLADAAKVAVGARAEIQSELLPDRTFEGTVTRLVHKADIQRNTVEAKVSITDPSPLLKPDVLTRVRFFAPSLSISENASSSPPTARSELLIPRAAIHNHADGRAELWIARRESQTAVAEHRSVTTAGDSGEFVIVTSGLAAGDRVIVESSAELRDGARIRIAGERTQN